MTTQSATRLALLAGATLFGLTLATATWAADVKELVEGCNQCHGKDGASTAPDVAIIGGVSAPYTTDSMTDTGMVQLSYCATRKR